MKENHGPMRMEIAISKDTNGRYQFECRGAHLNQKDLIAAAHLLIKHAGKMLDQLSSEETSVGKWDKYDAPDDST